MRKHNGISWIWISEKKWEFNRIIKLSATRPSVNKVKVKDQSYKYKGVASDTSGQSIGGHESAKFRQKKFIADIVG